MLILIIRTDKPEAEVGLFEDQEQLAYETWHAHRELSVTLHQKINTMLASCHKSVHHLDGIVGFAGPGSFTGLRIGLATANALAYGLAIPVVAAKGEVWIRDGITRLLSGHRDQVALPEYGAPVHITQQRK